MGENVSGFTPLSSLEINLPTDVRFCEGKKRHPHARLVHVSHILSADTLCGRVRTGRFLETVTGLDLCSRCLSRALDLYCPTAL